VSSKAYLDYACTKCRSEEKGAEALTIVAFVVEVVGQLAAAAVSCACKKKKLQFEFLRERPPFSHEHHGIRNSFVSDSSATLRSFFATMPRTTIISYACIITFCDEGHLDGEDETSSTSSPLLPGYRCHHLCCLVEQCVWMGRGQPEEGLVGYADDCNNGNFIVVAVGAGVSRH